MGISNMQYLINTSLDAAFSGTKQIADPAFVNNSRQKHRYAPIAPFLIVALAGDGGRLLLPNASIDKVGMSAKAPDKLFVKIRAGEPVWLEATPAVPAHVDEESGKEVAAVEAAYYQMKSEEAQTITIEVSQEVVQHATLLEYNRSIDQIIRRKARARRL